MTGLPSESRIALESLAHPWSLLALATLAFNDHVWKGLGPGWLTGKLSDFAGLFFFPFVLIAFVGLLSLGKRRGYRLPIARIAFAIVFVWFAAAKSVPAVHAATSAFAKMLVGDVVIALDPTDTIALIALIPSYLLYRRIARAPTRRLRLVLQPATLGVAVLLTAATSRPRIPSVTNLISEGDQLVAVVEIEASREVHIYTSSDGLTWMAQAGALTQERIAKHKPQTSIVVDGDRIDIVGRAVRGQKPADNFSIPQGREDFIRSVGADIFEWKARDIATVPSFPSTVVVAMGSEGIVVRDASGRWRRRGIGGARPSPTKTDSRGAARLLITSRWVFASAIGLLVWTLLALSSWSCPSAPIPSARSVQAGRLQRWLARLPSLSSWKLRRFEVWHFAYAVPAMLCMAAVVVFLKLAALGALVAWTFSPLLLIALLFVCLGWRRFRKTRGRSSLQLLPSVVGAALAAGAIALWDIGVVESLATAMILAAGVCLALVVTVGKKPGAAT